MNENKAESYRSQRCPSASPMIWTQPYLKSSSVCGLWGCRTGARCNCKRLANIAPHLSSNFIEYKKNYQLKFTNSTDIKVLLFQKQNLSLLLPFGLWKFLTHSGCVSLYLSQMEHVTVYLACPGGKVRLPYPGKYKEMYKILLLSKTFQYISPRIYEQGH